MSEEKCVPECLVARACICEADGFCPRWQRQMIGRVRQICGGRNIDCRAALDYQANWGREADARGWFGWRNCDWCEMPGATHPQPFDPMATFHTHKLPGCRCPKCRGPLEIVEGAEEIFRLSDRLLQVPLR